MIFYHITVDSAHFTRLATSYREYIRHGCSSTLWGPTCDMWRRSRVSLAPQRVCSVAGRCAGEAGSGEDTKDLQRDSEGPCQSVTALGCLHCIVWGIKSADLGKDLLSLYRLEPVSDYIKCGWKVGADSLRRLPRSQLTSLL